MDFRAPRGASDVLPADQPYWAQVRNISASVAASFGYARIDTPAFEATALFERGVDDETDVVEKEMYTFEDRGGDSMTLKPEGTAPVCRAYLEHGMGSLPQPVRLYYQTPIFRYDRPQAGRTRQHHQFGIEAIGDASPEVDAEVIELGWSVLRDLKLTDILPKVNSIGDGRCRPAYLSALREYYAPHVSEMCDDCKRRFTDSPLRLLDDKKESCQRFAADAPQSIDFLCDECADHWAALLTRLDDLATREKRFSYELDHRLVRGLDYYTRTVFEFHPLREGAQSAVISGGRYDGLIEQLGGEPTPGIGFGCGFERVILNMRDQEIVPPSTRRLDAVLVHADEHGLSAAQDVAGRLRSAGLAVVIAPAGRSMRRQMRFADGQGARYAVILGERELERGVATVRPLDGGGQTEVSLDNDALIAAIAEAPASS